MCSTKVIPSCCSRSRPRGVFIPRAREGQCLPAWVRRAAHWQGRAASAVCEKRVAASSRIELADPRRRRGILRRLYKSTPGCFKHIACRFPAGARHANPVLHIRRWNLRRNPWLATNQSICASRARGDKNSPPMAIGTLVEQRREVTERWATFAYDTVNFST